MIDCSCLFFYGIATISCLVAAIVLFFANDRRKRIYKRYEAVIFLYISFIYAANLLIEFGLIDPIPLIENRVMNSVAAFLLASLCIGENIYDFFSRKKA